MYCPSSTSSGKIRLKDFVDQRDENSIDLPQSTVQLRNQFLQAGHTTRPSLSLSVLEA